MGWNLTGNIKGPKGDTGGGGADTGIVNTRFLGSASNAWLAADAGKELQYAYNSAGTLALYAAKLPQGAVSLLRNVSGKTLAISGTPALGAGALLIGLMLPLTYVTGPALPADFTQLGVANGITLGYKITTASEPTQWAPTTRAALQTLSPLAGPRTAADIANYAITPVANATSGSGSLTLPAVTTTVANQWVIVLAAASAVGASGVNWVDLATPSPLSEMLHLPRQGQCAYVAAAMQVATPSTVGPFVFPVTTDSAGAPTVAVGGATLTVAPYATPAPGSFVAGAGPIPRPGGAIVISPQGSTPTLSTAGALALMRADSSTTIYVNGELDA